MEGTLAKDHMQPATAIVKHASYWLTRFVILRLLGAIYAIAFLVAINQIVPLIGSDGLLPINIFTKQITSSLGSTSAAFFRLPSLFWFWHSDTALLIVHGLVSYSP